MQCCVGHACADGLTAVNASMHLCQSLHLQHMVRVFPHFYHPADEQSPAMPPVGTAFLPQETLVTAAGTQSVYIPDFVGNTVTKE